MQRSEMQKLEIDDLLFPVWIVQYKAGGCAAHVNGKVIAYNSTAVSIREDYALCKNALFVANELENRATQSGLKKKQVALREEASQLIELIKRNRIFHEHIQN
jgi:hypothetical protein